MSLQLGDVAVCITWSYKLYQFACGPEYNAPDRYLEFQRDVLGFHENLTQLKAVFEKVHSRTLTDIPSGSGFYDTNTLNDVLDQPLRTIKECWRFLHENVNFKNNGSHINNIIWNVFVEDSVEQLHKKIRFHNVKILALLKPLELKLLLDIQSLITQYGEAMLREFDDLRDQLRSFRQQQPEASREVKDITQITVPDHLRNRFESAAKAAKKDVLFDLQFPMHDGINAFLVHSLESADNVTKQYVDLMKGIWIIHRILGSSQYIKTIIGGNRLLRFFVADLGRKCLVIFNRLDRQADPFKLVNEPREEELAPLGPEAFMIWPYQIKRDKVDLALDSINTIFHAPLVHPDSKWSREVLLYKHEETALEMMIKDTSEDSTMSQSKERNIDLRIVRLNLIYADPLNESNRKDVVLYTSGALFGSNDHFEFKTDHAMKGFQEAITGYRVMEDFVNVGVLVMEDTPKKYMARVQLWDYKGHNAPNTTTAASGSPRRDSLSPSAAGSRPSYMMPNSRRLGGENRSALNTGSQSSTYSRKTLLSGVTAVGDTSSMGLLAYSFEAPKEPFLVLFLRAKAKDGSTTANGNAHGDFERHMIYSKETVSVMKIPIGRSSARLELGNCSCHNTATDTNCNHSCLIGSKSGIFRGTKPLMVQHYKEEVQVNLAQLGNWHIGIEGSGQKAEKEKVNHVKFHFREPMPTKQPDRKIFDKRVNEYAKLHDIRWAKYEATKVNVRRRPKKGEKEADSEDEWEN